MGGVGTVEVVAPPIDEKSVRKLERVHEAAIAGVIVRRGSNTSPLLTARHTLYMMAKAAVAIYEVVVEDDERESKEQS